MPKRNTFSREFKLEAIRQMEAGDKKAAITYRIATGPHQGRSPNPASA